MNEIEKGDWIEVNINGFVDECKVIMFSERGIEVSVEWVDEVEKYWIEWSEIDSVKKYIPANIDTEEKG